MMKLTTLLITVLILTNCSNTNKKFNKEENLELNSDSTTELSPEQQIAPSSNEVDINKIPLDSLLSFNSERELKKMFGDDVKRSIGYYPEGMGEYSNSLLYPNSKNEVEFVWEDDSLSFSGLHYLKLEGKETDWKTKEGITIGTTIKELETLNKKAFTFYGLGWDYAGTIDWEDGNLEERKIFGRLEYPNDTMPNEFNSLLGDHKIKSASETAKKAKLVLGEITMENE